MPDCRLTPISYFVMKAVFLVDWFSYITRRESRSWQFGAFLGARQVQFDRSQWGIYSTSLPEFCRWLRASLSHRDLGSDPEAGCIEMSVQPRTGDGDTGIEKKGALRG